ncbi:hypothetical protein [Legionella oakridgensis]|uniref:Cupin domain protein n=1 Tax=Legionella oakridgensis TaxID=29423 RepID=A0A0W0XDA5_9GAMM|nr:hypothetical protein [Legionella oakridgensis]KTD42533.1 hypothetical protein Loak_0727 [Legionella oakridgensis]STY21092.1 Uncharacterised protein [Legionella longbeachae]
MFEKKTFLTIPLAILGFSYFLSAGNLYANSKSSHRIPQFANNEVTVWKTVIYPASKQRLPMHRHEHDRVLIAFTNGLLKITNNQGKTHYLKLKKDNAYYLKKDPANELHIDENMTNHPIKVMVVELNH